MRRIIFVLMLTTALLSGCYKYDDTHLRDQISDINGRLEKLEQLCNRLNTNIDALQSIVEALQRNDHVTSVEPIREGDKIIGYTIIFSKSESITIYHGKDGASGSDGHTPQIGVAKDDDGNYYWTVDGEWLLDNDGQKIRANGIQGEDGASGQDGVTPKFKIDEGYWFVSYDNGTHWEQLGKASGEDGDSMFSEIRDDEDSVTFILTDGTELVLPKKAEQEISVDVSEIGSRSAVFSGKLVLPSTHGMEVHVVYSKDYAMADGSTVSLRIDDKAVDGRYTVPSGTLDLDTRYYYTYSVKEDGAYSYGEVKSFRTKGVVDLAASGTANCYIVCEAGVYRFPAVKGNGSEPAGAVASAEVLWESFGTDMAPEAGDLVSGVKVDGNIIEFTASGVKGNAVIAAKDSSGKILWSWHIWMPDGRPEDQVYNNGAGTMMDRNLGAVSATPGDVGTSGLLYQWGRKDPFLGSSAISSNIRAESTLSWPSPVESTSSTGTIEYAVSNPVTFITSGSNNYDWHYTGDDSTDDARWQSTKTIHDPCPPGYRVPEGGIDGVWSNAFGSSLSFDKNAYDHTHKGCNFGSSGECANKLSTSASTCWYPAAGYLNSSFSSLAMVGSNGFYWSCSPDGYNACRLSIYSNGSVYPSNSSVRAVGHSVRCLKE